eukprot:gene30931-38230_t
MANINYHENKFYEQHDLDLFRSCCPHAELESRPRQNIQLLGRQKAFQVYSTTPSSDPIRMFRGTSTDSMTSVDVKLVATDANGETDSEVTIDTPRSIIDENPPPVLSLPPSKAAELMLHQSADEDAFALGMLLSAQDERFGFNMMDALTSQDLEEVDMLVNTIGCSKQDARKMVFEDKFESAPQRSVSTSSAASSPQMLSLAHPSATSSTEHHRAVRFADEPAPSSRTPSQPVSRNVSSDSNDSSTSSQVGAFRMTGTNSSSSVSSSSPVVSSPPPMVQSSPRPPGLPRTRSGGLSAFSQREMERQREIMQDIENRRAAVAQQQQQVQEERVPRRIRHVRTSSHDSPQALMQFEQQQFAPPSPPQSFMVLQDSPRGGFPTRQQAGHSRNSSFDRQEQQYQQQQLSPPQVMFSQISPPSLQPSPARGMNPQGGVFFGEPSSPQMTATTAFQQNGKIYYVVEAPAPSQVQFQQQQVQMQMPPARYAHQQQYQQQNALQGQNVYYQVAASPSPQQQYRTSPQLTYQTLVDRQQ